MSPESFRALNENGISPGNHYVMGADRRDRIYRESLQSPVNSDAEYEMTDGARASVISRVTIDQRWGLVITSYLYHARGAYLLLSTFIRKAHVVRLHTPRRYGRIGMRKEMTVERLMATRNTK